MQTVIEWHFPQMKVNVKAGEKNVAFEALMTIAQPKRWDVDSPYLYKVYSRLKNKRRSSRLRC